MEIMGVGVCLSHCDIYCSAECGPSFGEAPGRSGYRASARLQGICVYGVTSFCHSQGTVCGFGSLRSRSGPRNEGRIGVEVESEMRAWRLVTDFGLTESGTEPAEG